MDEQREEQTMERQPEQEVTPSEKPKKPGWRQELYSELRLLIGVLTVTMILFHFLTQLIVVVGSSMYPTLHNGDLLLAWRAGYHAQQGDIVVLHKETAVIQETIVKRVIATGGQTVEIDYDANKVYVDGVQLDESYINPETDCLDHTGDAMVPAGDMVSIDVPKGSVFVMGDNRNHSTDSRFSFALGTVDEGYIIGKAIFVFFPFNHACWMGD